MSRMRRATPDYGAVYRTQSYRKDQSEFLASLHQLASLIQVEGDDRQFVNSRLRNARAYLRSSIWGAARYELDLLLGWLNRNGHFRDSIHTVTH